MSCKFPKTFLLRKSAGKFRTHSWRTWTSWRLRSPCALWNVDKRSSLHWSHLVSISSSINPLSLIAAEGDELVGLMLGTPGRPRTVLRLADSRSSGSITADKIPESRETTEPRSAAGTWTAPLPEACASSWWEAALSPKSDCVRLRPRFLRLLIVSSPSTQVSDGSGHGDLKSVPTTPLLRVPFKGCSLVLGRVCCCLHFEHVFPDVAVALVLTWLVSSLASLFSSVRSWCGDRKRREPSRNE